MADSRAEFGDDSESIEEPIPPLDAATFVSRLNSLSASLNDIARLEDAFNKQLSRDRAIPVSLDGREYFVASIDDLIAMKTDAGRPQDLLDVETLERIKRRIGKG